MSRSQSINEGGNRGILLSRNYTSLRQGNKLLTLSGPRNSLGLKEEDVGGGG